MLIARVTGVLCLVMLSACGSSPRSPDLERLYGRTAREGTADRRPVVVIPGILGSKLVDPRDGRIVWGAFTYGAADADHPDGARLVALPMREGAPLAELRDEVEPDGVLETLEANVALFKITAIEPYKGIIRSLAAGRYVDRDILRAQRAKQRGDGGGPINYAGAHVTCFQFDYDWRRDVSESAARLDALVKSASVAAAREGEAWRKVDLVAHSMGGLVARYYLMYGTAPMAEDGSLPELTWAGSERVNQLVCVGTPGTGSVLALKELIEGVNYGGLITPTYRPAVLGTFPSIYQLMPRSRHGRVVDGATGEPVGELYDVATWEKYDWGLADPKQDRYLSWLLPGVASASERRRIALDELAKCLRRAEQFHRALDRDDAIVPAGLTLRLIAGDADATPDVLAVDAATGRVRVTSTAPGDGTVTRASALGDERTGSAWSRALRSSVAWDSVQFIPEDHVGLTSSAVFTDNLLFALLEN